MKKINSIEDLKLEIQRLKDLKTVQEEIIVRDWELIHGFFSPVFNTISIVKNFFVPKNESSIWVEILGFLWKEIKERQIFSTSLTGIFSLLKTLFARKS